MISRLTRAARAFAAPETRAADDASWGALLAGAQGGGVAAVTPARAEQLAAVQACVGVIAGSLATLPAYLRMRQGDAWVVADSHPAARLIANPCPQVNWVDFIEWLVAQTLLYGNGLAEVRTDARGQPVELRPIPWPSVSPLVLSSGKLAFDVASGNGQTRRLLADEVLLLKDRSDDGLLGRSRISRSPEVFANALALSEWSLSAWRNSTAPSGVVGVPPSISPEGMRRMRAAFEGSHVGTANARRTIFMDAGSTWQPHQPVSPVDAEMSVSRRFATEEIARIFNTPPPLISDYSNNTLTNSVSASRRFAQHTLRPWAAKLEAAFQNVLAPQDRETYSLFVDMSGLTRGDDQARWQSYQIAVQNGILTPAEVRQQEGWNASPDAPAVDPVVG